MATLDARDYSPDGPHAGTDADPWPGAAIKSALEDLPQPGGGTVFVANGKWLVNSLLEINGVNDFVLQGESLAAELKFLDAGQMWFGSAGGGTGGIASSTFSTLTWNCNGLEVVTPHAALRVSSATDCTFSGNKVIGHSNGGMPGTFWEGGRDNLIDGNEFVAPAGGDSVLQIQTGSSLDNSDFVVSNNTFDSAALVVIGLSNVQVIGNTLTNTTLANTIGIQVCGPFTGGSSNILVDGNIVNADESNGAVITGLPNDPGGSSIIDNFTISNNTLTGTFASIHAQSFDDNNFHDNTLLNNEKTNMHIIGNTLNSAWGGSGINLRGGAGRVDTVEVRGNTLIGALGFSNSVDRDANTFNVTIVDNIGIENDPVAPIAPHAPIPFNRRNVVASQQRSNVANSRQRIN